MVRIEAGEFEVGTIDGAATPLAGGPLQRRSVAGYELDVAEVTVRDFEACVGAKACDSVGLDADTLCNWKRPGREGHPINCTSFSQAEAFCAWEQKRLPTEIEWEVAAVSEQLPCVALEYGEAAVDQGRVCLTAEYSGGRWGEQRGTCAVDRDRPALPKLGIPALSKLGLLDMMGNVSEWVSDSFCKGPAPYCAEHVLRGTAWLGDLYENSCRHRWREPGTGGFNAGRRVPAQIGFRCARSLTG